MPARSKTSDVSHLPADPIGWIESEFWIPERQYEDNKAIQLVPYQRAVIREALTRDDGALRYSLVLWSDLKKSAKSVISGAVALWLAWHHDWETVRIVGNDLKQASSRTFDYIRRAIELNPRLKAACKITGYKISLPNHTTIEAVPIDPGGEAGGGDLFLCWTELWAAKHDKALRMWTETTLSPLKFGKSLRWCESYAGFIGESPILEQLYDSAVTNGDRVMLVDNEAPIDLELSRSGRTLALWNTQPRCEWQTPDYYAQEESVLAPSEMDRVHRNRWVSSQQVFVPYEWWKACAGEVSAAPNQVVVALDAAVTNDCFAVVTAARRGGKTYVKEARIWTPLPNRQIEIADVEAYIKELASRYTVMEFTYDPMQLKSTAQRFQGRIGYFREFPQGVDRLEADKALYDTIRDRQLVHPDIPDLNSHVANANADINQEGNKLRIVKRNDHLKIDAAVALSMANARLIHFFRDA